MEIFFDMWFVFVLKGCSLDCIGWCEFVSVVVFSEKWLLRFVTKQVGFFVLFIWLLDLFRLLNDFSLKKKSVFYNKCFKENSFCFYKC